MSEFLIELRYAADETRQSQGRLTGVLMPYGTVSPSHREMFEDGSLHWPDDGITIRGMHKLDQPLLKTIPFMDGSELRIDAMIPDTVAGRDARVNLSGPNPLYSGLSVEFQSERETRRGGLRVIQQALLTGGGLCDRPSYLRAQAELRSQAEKRRYIWWL